MIREDTTLYTAQKMEETGDTHYTCHSPQLVDTPDTAQEIIDDTHATENDRTLQLNINILMIHTLNY